MSTIIEKLHELITPEILGFVKNEDGGDDAKKGVLGALYSLLAVRLTDSNVANRLASLDGEEVTNGELILGELFKNEETPVNSAGLLTTLSQTLGREFSLSENTAHTLSLAGLPLAYNQLKNLAAGDMVTYLTPHKESLVASLPNWLTALLPAGLLAGLGVGLSSAAAAPVNPLVEMPTPEPAPAPEPAPVVAPVVTAPVAPAQIVKEEKKEGGFLKGLLPFIAALIIAFIAWLMLKGCQQQPVQVAVPPPETPAQIEQANLIPATLKLALNEKGDGLYAFDSSVGSEGLGEEVKQAVFGVFGDYDKAKINVGSDVAKEMPALQYLPQIFGFMKGVPDASISIDGKTIRINSSNQEALDKLLKDLKTALPDDFTVEAEPVLNAEEAVAKSLDDAQNAINALTENSTANELVRALNLQIINFASGSSEIPAANQAILDKASELMTKIPNVKLKIVGHTDNKGSMASNQKLSESRAKAVRDYLVSKGVSEELLSIHGASYTEPVASNATEQGRFANRRIEFTLSQDGEAIAKVGNADSDKPQDDASETTKPAEQPTTAEPADSESPESEAEAAADEVAEPPTEPTE